MAAKMPRKRSLFGSSLLLLAAAFILLNVIHTGSSKVGTGRDLLSSDNEDSDIGKDQARACNCTLITSPGGAGSTQFIQLVQMYEKEERLCLNHQFDFDNVKHLPAASFDQHDTNSISYKEHCFSKVLVIVGDPINAIASTYRRHHKTDHLNKLRKAAGRDPYDKETVSLESIFTEMDIAGEDTTGIVHYMDSWLAAASDPASWPQTRIVTTKDLYNFAKANARYVGILDEEKLKYFDLLHFRDPERVDHVSERIREIFAPIQSKLERASRNALMPYLLSEDHLLSLV